MSRIGRKPITIPSGVDIRVEGNTVSVKGPLGQLNWELAEGVNATLEDRNLLLNRTGESSRVACPTWISSRGNF